MNTSISPEELLAQAREWLSWLRDYVSAFLESGAANALEQFPELQHYLPQLFEFCVLSLALAVLLLARRSRRDRRAMRGLLAELQTQRSQLRDFAEAHVLLEEKIARTASSVADVAERQRGVEARVGKPDPKLAAAMTRAGAARRQMIDSGLSHGEVHLLRALASAA